MGVIVAVAVTVIVDDGVVLWVIGGVYIDSIENEEDAKDDDVYAELEDGLLLMLLVAEALLVAKVEKLNVLDDVTSELDDGDCDEPMGDEIADIVLEKIESMLEDGTALLVAKVEELNMLDEMTSELEDGDELMNEERSEVVGRNASVEVGLEESNRLLDAGVAEDVDGVWLKDFVDGGCSDELDVPRGVEGVEYASELLENVLPRDEEDVKDPKRLGLPELVVADVDNWTVLLLVDWAVDTLSKTLELVEVALEIVDDPGQLLEFVIAEEDDEFVEPMSPELSNVDRVDRMLLLLVDIVDATDDDVGVAEPELEMIDNPSVLLEVKT